MIRAVANVAQVVNSGGGGNSSWPTHLNNNRIEGPPQLKEFGRAGN